MCTSCIVIVSSISINFFSLYDVLMVHSIFDETLLLERLKGKKTRENFGQFMFMSKQEGGLVHFLGHVGCSNS